MKRVKLSTQSKKMTRLSSLLKEKMPKKGVGGSPRVTRGMVSKKN